MEINARKTKIPLILFLLLISCTGCADKRITVYYTDNVNEYTLRNTYENESDSSIASTETLVNYDSNYASMNDYYSALADNAVSEGRNVVYLTFDDGSSVLTSKVLDILEQYNVKATFFVVGKFSSSDVNAKECYLDILKRGHSLGIHSYTHSRTDIYASLEAFSYDCSKMRDYVYNLTGYTPWLYRFPGGSTSIYADEKMKTQYIPYIESIGMVYYDWNVSSGDGSSDTTAEQIYNNVIQGVSENSVSVVLCHDGIGRENTLTALPKILDTLINDMNCLIIPITENTVPVQFQL